MWTMNFYNLVQSKNLLKEKIICAAYFIVNNSTTWKVIGRSCNQETINYEAVVLKINNLKSNQPLLFTRMYRLSPESFYRILEIIRNNLIPRKPGGKNCVPPMIKLCIGLRILAGGSYLDILFGYNVHNNVVHHYGWQALQAIDQSSDSFLFNIKSPIYNADDELEELEHGFASLSNFKLRGTVAAGDGVVFQMAMPTNEDVDGDVTAYYTRKGYYAYGLQAFCNSNCKLVVIASKLCS
jgi:hypothetical protein